MATTNERRLRHLATCMRGAAQHAASAQQLRPSAAGPAAWDSEALVELSISSAAEAFANKTLSPVTLLEACLERLDATEGTYCSFVRDMRVTAREQAAASEARWASGTARGPMDGIPICLKDIYDTEGVVTAGGCFALRDRVPDEDAHTVALLREAGAVFVGKSYTVEFASGGLLNPQYRPELTVNPWRDTAGDFHQPGGSSSGTAAAVAGRQVLAGTGSCTGGSIRGPAAFCNLTGHKPTYGLCSKRGVMPLSKTLDHTGPMCRSAMDCAIFLDAMKGFDPLDPCALPAPNPAESIAEMLRSSEGSAPVDAVLVVVPSMVAGCTPEVLAHFEASLEVLKSLGCTVVEAEPLAGFDPEAMAKAKQISQIEKAAYIEEILRERPTEVSPMCQRQSLAALELVNDASKGKDVSAGALEARREIEMRFEATLAAHGGPTAFYATPTIKQTASRLPVDLEDQDVLLADMRARRYNTALFVSRRRDTAANRGYYPELQGCYSALPYPDHSN